MPVNAPFKISDRFECPNTLNTSVIDTPRHGCSGGKQYALLSNEFPALCWSTFEAIIHVKTSESFSG